MSDRIAVMNARQGRAAGHARGALRAAGDALRGRLHRHDQPAARRRSSADGGRPPRRRASSVAVDARRPRARRPASRSASGRSRSALAARRPPRAPSAARVEQAAYLGTNVSYQRPHDGRDRPHRPRPEDRDPTPGRQRRRRRLAAVRGPRPRRGPARRRGGGSGMTDPHDGSIDRPRARARPLHGRAADQPARPARADRASSGGAAALAPIIAACTSAAAPRRRPPRRGRRRRRRRRPPSSAAPAGGGRPTPEPTPVPSPEGELFIYNWAEYIGEDVIPSFEEKYGIKVTYDFFDDYDDDATPRSATDGGGYDITLPDLGRHPRRCSSAGLIQTLDKSLIPNIGNLGAEWANPGYDPGNTHSDPVHVVDDRRRLRHGEGHGEARPAGTRCGTSGTSSTSRCSTTGRRSFAAGAVPAGLSDPNTTERRRARRGARAARGAEAARPDVHRPTTSAMLSTATPGSATPGAPTCTRSSRRRPERSSTTSPRRAASAAPTRWSLLAGAKHPIAAQLFINHLLDAKVSADEHELHRLHGPQRRGQGVHRPGASSRTRR